jgi:hypothetical protein
VSEFVKENEEGISVEGEFKLEIEMDELGMDETEPLCQPFVVLFLFIFLNFLHLFPFNFSYPFQTIHQHQ